MQDIERLLNNLNKLNINDIFYSLWSDNKVQNYIIKLNTSGEKTSQLYSLGVDANGVALGDYTFNTIQMKLAGDGNKRVDHITLTDSGDFYKSFVVAPNKKGFELKADPITDDGTNLFDRFGEDVVGLTKDNQKLLIGFIESDFNKELEKRLLQ